MTDGLRASGEWKIHLAMKINFILSKDDGESQPLHFKSDNIEIMTGNNTNEIKELQFCF